MSGFEKWRNPGKDTYNGAAMFAELTGIPRAEIVWMAERMKELKAAGVPKEDWSGIVKAESAAKPWLPAAPSHDQK